MCPGNGFHQSSIGYSAVYMEAIKPKNVFVIDYDSDDIHPADPQKNVMYVQHEVFSSTAHENEANGITWSNQTQA